MEEKCVKATTTRLDYENLDEFPMRGGDLRGDKK